MPLSQQGLPCQRGVVTSLLHLILFVAIIGCEVADADPVEVESGLYLVLSEPDQGCRGACSENNLICNKNSLERGVPYFSSDVLAYFVDLAGGSCSKVTGNRDGTSNPKVTSSGKCFAKNPAKTNFNCWIPGGKPGSRRLCSCFPNNLNPPPTNPPKVDNVFNLPTPTTTPTTTPTPTTIPSQSPVPSLAPSQSSNPTTTFSPTNGIPPGYNLVWRDDFDGNDINTDNWSRGLIYDKNPKQHVLWNPKVGGNGLLSALYDGYNRDENVVVRKGQIELTNREENPPFQGTDPPGLFNYSSAFANSLHKVYFNGSEKSIYLETRALMPFGNVGKVWAAIWMVPESEDWPPEIDIWEYFGLFFNPKWGYDEMQFRVRYGWAGNTTAAKIKLKNFQTVWGADWHIYGWHWTSKTMTWYIDGWEVGKIERGVDLFPWRWPREDMAFVLQNALMESIDPNDPAMTTEFPNTMAIDYMAVYQEP